VTSAQNRKLDEKNFLRGNGTLNFSIENTVKKTSSHDNF